MLHVLLPFLFLYMTALIIRGGGGWGYACKYIHVLLQSANLDAVIFTSYDKINKVYGRPLTLKNDNDSNVSVQDYSQHPNNQQPQPLLWLME